jgi:hypothetical protein
LSMQAAPLPPAAGPAPASTAVFLARHN